MPPLVNKKIEKRVRNGEHGRYECFYNPIVDDDGQVSLQLYEYLATEHGGYVLGENGHPVENGDRCRFKPQEWAPTASYFIMQIIGGGGGGAYPPYDGSSTYKANRTDSNNVVKLLFEPINSSDNTYMHSGSNYFNQKMTYAHNKTTNYTYEREKGSQTFSFNNSSRVTGTKYYKNCASKRWVYDYFPPVLSYNNSNEIKICSGHGSRGAGTKDATPSNPYPLDPNDENSPMAVNLYYSAEYGHRGGYGYCVKAAGNRNNSRDYNIALGRDDGDYFQIATNSPINSIDYAAYTKRADGNYDWLSYVPFDYDPYVGNTDVIYADNTDNGIRMVSGVQVAGTDKGYLSDIVVCPYTAQTSYSANTSSNYSDLAGFGIVANRVANLLGHTRYNNEEPKYISAVLDKGKAATSNDAGYLNTICAASIDNRQYKSGATTYFSSERIKFNALNKSNPTQTAFETAISGLDMGITISAKHYNASSGLVAANCSIPGGASGNNDRAEELTLAQLQAGDVAYSDFSNNCSSIWQDAGSNQNATYNGRKYTTSGSWFPDLVTSNEGGESDYGFFPYSITMSRTAPEYTTTYGFGGRPGESVGLSFSKLTGTLEFTVGLGGRAGDINSRGGISGEHTVVYRKSVGSEDSLDCSTPSDDPAIETARLANCTVMAEAKGGKAFDGGGSMGKTISLRGEHTCDTRNASGAWLNTPVHLDGCLDIGAGPDTSQNSSNGGNTLRFAEDSAFYVIPELQDGSRTRSLIEDVYKSKGLNMPGSGGDGGYTFLKKIETTDTEEVQAKGHTNFTPDSMAALGNGVWTVHPTKVNTLVSSTSGYDSDSNQDFSNYRCYLRGDTTQGHGASPITFPGQNETGLCMPHSGFPGAVVIVW